MKKFLTGLVPVILATILLAGATMAAGGGQLTSYPLVGPETNIQIKYPFDISWGAASLSIPISNNITLYPGDKIAEVSVTIENVSPNSYEVYFNAQPDTVKNDVWPAIEVKLLPESQYGYASSTTIAAGEKKELHLEIKIAFYSQLATFQGITIYLNYGPPRGELG